MQCDHCAFSCTKIGKDMSRKVFMKALERFSGHHITLGGGEPTLHPLFMEFFGHAICEAEGLFMVTNGTNSALSLKLLNFAKQVERYMFDIELSLDCYHEYTMVDQDVIRAFDRAKRIRTVEGKVVKTGRAALTGAWDEDDVRECVCDDLVIEPDGEVFSCGCRQHYIGNIMNKVFHAEEYQIGHNAERDYAELMSEEERS